MCLEQRQCINRKLIKRIILTANGLNALILRIKLADLSLEADILKSAEPWRQGNWRKDLSPDAENAIVNGTSADKAENDDSWLDREFRW